MLLLGGDQLIAFRIIYIFNLLYTLDNLVNGFWAKNKPKTCFYLFNKILVDCLSSCLCFICNNLQSILMKFLELDFKT